MSKGSKQRPSSINQKTFADNFDAIFGSESDRKKQADERDAKRAEAAESRRPHTQNIGVFEPFVSPVDGTVISDNRKLREHNKRHGVTNTRDYGEDWFPRKAKEMEAERTGQTRQAKAERIELIKETMHKHGYRS